MNLLLFSASYPYDFGAEQTFLSVEINHLKNEFDRVILIPRRCKGNWLPLPPGFEVDTSYSTFLAKIKIFNFVKDTLFSSILYEEITSLPWLLRYPIALKRLLAFLYGAQMTRTWIENWFLRTKVEAADCLFYTYWLDQAAYGIGLAKQKHPQLKLVSRVHGYDLYEEYYYQPAYWPRRPATLLLLDRLFPDANAGLAYLQKRYPKYSNIYETGLLGVTDPGFATLPSFDGVFRIVSCSILDPVKRVDLLLEGIANAARRRPGQRFEWHHFGNGANRLELQDAANLSYPPNAKGNLPGYSTKDNLMKYYQENPVDIFVNVSGSEGTPVAIMEAISCGIPVLATAVGGNVEIVSEKNGVLLDPNPTPKQIGNALLSLLDDHTTASQKRQASRKMWMERYNADSNFQAFAEKLSSIRKS